MVAARGSGTPPPMKTLSSRIALLVLSLSTFFTASAAHADEARAPASPDAARAEDRGTGRGVSLGFDNGLFGRAYEQGVRLRVPILEHFDLALRGVSAFGDREGELGWYAGGRAEIIGHSPVYLNLVRVYGGGGPEVTTRLQGSGGDKTLIGGGGEFGFEFFVSPRISFFAEIGGRAGDDLTGGGTAIAGMMLYPFAGP